VESNRGTAMLSNAIRRGNARPWMEKSKQNQLIRPLTP
jgi:hypothetical protein